MDLISLRYFVRVAELKSVTHAAELLRIAQPSLSRRIHELELDLGVKLFSRVNRGMRLTEAGERLVEGARRILQEVDRVRDDVMAQGAVPSGTVVVGITPTLCPVVLPELVSRMRNYPQIELKIEQRGSLALPEWLLEGTIDLAIMADMTRSRLLDRIEVAKEEMVLVTAPTTQAPDIISWEQLSEVPLVLTHTIQMIMQKLIASRNLTLDVHSEMNSLEALRVMVQEGRCATILPYSFARREFEMGLFGVHRILDDSMKRQIIIARSKARQETAAVRFVSNLCVAIFTESEAQGRFTIKAASDLKAFARV